MPSAKSKTPKKPPEPDDVVRETAGNYVSGDGRFEIRQSESNWYLVDREQKNEFGQELMHGPFGSLKAARSAMPGARDIKPLLRSQARPKRTPEKEKTPPAPPPSWIDRLPRGEAAEVRKLVRALEKEGIDDAEALVRRDRGALAPAIATHMIEGRLRALVEELPVSERASAERIVRRVAEILSREGTGARGPVPGWGLVEVNGSDRAQPRRITLA